MKNNLISHDISLLLEEEIFDNKIIDDFYDEFSDLNDIFKYDICEYLNNFIEINPRY